MTSPALALIVSLRIKPEQRARFLAAAEDNATCSVRDEPGCVRFDVLEDHAHDDRFFFYEVYRDEAAFQAHQQTAHFQRWRAAAGDVRSGPSERIDCTVLIRGESGAH